MKKSFVLPLSVTLIVVFVLGIAAASLIHTSPRAQAKDETQWRYMTVLSLSVQYYDANHTLLANSWDVTPNSCEYHFFVIGLDDSDSLKATIESIAVVQNYDPGDYDCDDSDRDPLATEDAILTQILNAAGSAGWEYDSSLASSLVFKRSD